MCKCMRAKSDYCQQNARVECRRDALERKVFSLPPIFGGSWYHEYNANAFN